MEPVVLFDGVCNLCSHSVRFIIERDPHARFRFAALQSDVARKLLAERGHPPPPDPPTGVMLVEGDRVFERSDAALRVARWLRFPWKLAGIFWLVPWFVRDAVYDFIARHRYGWFGRTESCMMPTPAIRARFIG